MLNKIQEKVSFIESFSVHELLEVPVEKVSVAAIHSPYQLLDAASRTLCSVYVSRQVLQNALSDWPCDFQTQVHSVSSGRLSIRQNVLWNHRGRHFEWWGTMWPPCAVPQSLRIHGMAYSWCRLFQRPRSWMSLEKLTANLTEDDEQVDQCGDADLCEVSNVRLRIMGWP